MKRAIALALGLGFYVWSTLGADAQRMQPPIQPVGIGCAYNSSPPTLTSGWFGYVQCTNAGKLQVDASVSASITPFAPATTGTPFTATTGGVTGTLPAGAVVVAFNRSTDTPSYCKLGASSTVNDIQIPAQSWFTFTVGAATQLTCITASGTAVMNTIGGSGLPAGSGGGGGAGGGGGSVTQGTTPWITAGQGTAGSAASAVTTVQGIASMTPLFIQNATVPISTMNSTNSNNGITSPASAVFDDASPTAITENNFGFLRMSANRNLYTTFRDAAGNERGANVDASNRLTTAPTNVSGSIASGAVASGAVASGAVASGAFASGSIASGAMVDLGAVADSASTAGGTGTVNAKLRLMTTQLDTINTTLGGSIPAGTATIGTVGQLPYPVGSTPYTATNTGTTGATTATLAGASSVTTYLCGFSIRSNATAAATGNATVTGVITATLNYTHWTAPLASGIGVTEQVFSPCIPASGTNQSVAVVSPAPGSGGTVSVTAWGYKL